MPALPPTDRKRLAELVAKRAYEKKKVTLASGRESDFYVDCKNVTLHPEGLYLTAGAFLERIRSLPRKVVAVGGPTLGSDPIAAGISLLSWVNGDPLAAFIIRKEPKGHGTKAWVEGARFLENGTPVAIVEDVVTTGSSSLTAAAKAKEAGLTPVAIVCLVDREEGGGEAIRDAGYRFESILTASEVKRAAA